MTRLRGLAGLLPRSLFTNLGVRDSESARIPERIYGLVQAEEARSEKLIGWVQLVIAGVFATLYMIAPRPLDADYGMVGFEPVPVALTVYTGFTLVRLGLSYLNYLPGWLLVVSMLLDVAMLYGLIWSFHMSYGQPASFALKVPTFAFIFVFIAVRSLRFDPRFVLSQGIFAALGWLVVVGYALHDGGPDMVTRSFIEYLTSNQILIGAEFDKIFTLLVVTFVLSLALWRARVTLISAVTEGAAFSEVKRYFGGGVAEAITSGERQLMAGDVEDRDAAVIMLDVRGFTAFAANHPPREVVAALTELHARVIPLIEARGGIVDKFMGDGIMATFGAVRPSETAAADALAAMVAINAETKRWEAERCARGAAPLTLNGGVSAGRVLAAILGSSERLEFTVIGSAANLAAKLEKHNKCAGTRALTDAGTVARAGRSAPAELRDLGTMAVAGTGAPLHLFAID